ncbi:MAG: outer membrane beta-barrel protein [Ferruginibacter sp.]
MKKSIISLLTVTLFFCTTLSAQQNSNNQNKSTWSVYGGFNMNRFEGKNASVNDIKNDFSQGEHIGFDVQVAMSSWFYLQPGLQLKQKGSQNTDADFTKATAYLYYAEVPLYFVAKPAAGRGHLIIGIGPVLSYGLFGRWTTENPINYQKNSNGKVKFANSVNSEAAGNILYVKTYDVSVSVILGYQFGKSFFLQLNADQGFINTMPKFENGSSSNASDVKNMEFGITGGFRF